MCVCVCNDIAVSIYIRDTGEIFTNEQMDNFLDKSCYAFPIDWQIIYLS